MALPHVSVILPAYNAGPYLRRAVESVLAQEGGATIEILVVDDGSTDGTGERLRALTEEFPAIRPFWNGTNRGVSFSRNRALEAARGEWFALLDADDAFEPGRVQRLVAVAETQGCDLVADLPVFYDLAADLRAPQQLPASGALQWLTLEDLLQPDPETGLDLGLLKPLFNRRLHERGLLAYDEGIRHGEDFRLYANLLRAGARFALLREAGYLFSTRIGAVSGAYSPGSVTAVDYPAIARQVEALLDDMAAQGDLTPEIESRLHAVAARARRANRLYGWTVLRKGRFGMLLRWLRKSPENRQALLNVLRQKLAGKRGLPE